VTGGEVRCCHVLYLLPDTAEVNGEAVLVVLHLGAGDRLHLGRQRAKHLRGQPTRT